MQKILSIHENVQRLAADVPEVKIYIKSGLKSDRFRMYTENFGFHTMCVCFFIFDKFSKPTRAGDVKRRIFLGWPNIRYRYREVTAFSEEL